MHGSQRNGRCGCLHRFFPWQQNQRRERRGGGHEMLVCLISSLKKLGFNIGWHKVAGPIQRITFRCRGRGGGGGGGGGR